MRKRAELLSHVHTTKRQDNLPEIGKNIAEKAHRAGGAERFDAAAVPKNREVAFARLTSSDELLRGLERSISPTATKHDANTLHRLQPVPGIGNILSLVRRYEIPTIDRFPRGQDFASYGRLVQCAQESAGKRLGTSGKNIGNAPLPWAFSEAAVLSWRNQPQGPKYLVRLEKKQAQGKALTILAPTLARAVYDMLTRTTAFDRDQVLRASESSAGAPEVSRDTQRNEPESRVLTVLRDCVLERQGVPLGLVALSRTG